ncbi:serine hydrolase [Flavobacterium columnare]|uniref:serine hydrolase domain-containing protein n=1 Tax=Flavobacterium columnare TaxID=996 RepID=UPI0007F9C4D7|nr:serine hydrolase [Flavobacterium columnare]ANO49477.1 penicillin-binding protein [Flavobacterium columnare]APT22562.1 serine hydrolase [Flavobacterium columnare]PDS26176.1 serine hydrolase [Flavobacterium columnare] [Flavobacterium columnare NBRC 100251 = ATCC 23463]QOG90091.1 serine hydrolase [Flavobacterium columnare]QOG92747.1 serine hydrolase [Flavobacterium columnare]
MKKILGIITLVLIGIIGTLLFQNYPKLDLISGFSAKSVASGYFLENRSLSIIEKTDNDINLIDFAKNEINDQGKFAEASVYGFKKRKAIYREGLGAVLVNDDYDPNQPYLVPKRIFTVNKNIPFPYGNGEPLKPFFANIDYDQLNKAVSQAFEPNKKGKRCTRAVLVVYKDQIIAEKYAPNFTKNSRLLGWSMTKSITGTLFGILQKQGKLDINQPAPITEWKNDARKNITIHNLLQMNSGLEWDENYDKISDATRMLFQESDMTKSQIKKPLVGKPNASWNYSSGTTNLLSGIIRNQFKTHQEYLDFWYSALIDKIGMHSMIIETDLTGHYIGSSYAWATARDWAKFGLLYLHKGNWNGQQLFDPSWSRYVATPTPTSNNKYGAQFWLNASGALPDCPKNIYYADGFQGQRVFIIPSHDMVIVRLGYGHIDLNALVKEVLGSIK